MNYLNHIAYMPWAGLTDGVEIGAVKVSPWQSVASKLDSNTREKLQEHFAVFVDQLGKPSEAVCVLEVKTHISNADKSSVLKKAAAALVCSHITHQTIQSFLNNNCSIGPPSSEKYWLLETANLGSAQNIFRFGSLTQVWADTKFVMPKPPYLIECLFSAKGNEFLTTVGTLLNRWHRAGPDDQSILMALEWFRIAHTNSPEIPPKTKVVSMCTAFEALSGVSASAKDLALYVNKNLSTDQHLKHTGMIDSKPVTASKKAWWMHCFYKLRNDIVHGKPVTAKDFHFDVSGYDWLDHLIVADLLFFDMLCFRITQAGIQLSHRKQSSIDTQLGWK
jgi:hypothetical protein